jgi:hypothetical protein
MAFGRSFFFADKNRTREFKESVFQQKNRRENTGNF